MHKLFTLTSIIILSSFILSWCGTSVQNTKSNTWNIDAQQADNGQEVDVIGDAVWVAEDLADEWKLDGIETVSYQEYTKETFAKSLEEKKDVVLFFHADRCPSCKALDEDINTNIASLPENIALLKVDYDQEDTLKRLYQVRQQHTLVFLNQDGSKKELTTRIARTKQVIEKLN